VERGEGGAVGRSSDVSENMTPTTPATNLIEQAMANRFVETKLPGGGSLSEQGGNLVLWGPRGEYLYGMQYSQWIDGLRPHAPTPPPTSTISEGHMLRPIELDCIRVQVRKAYDDGWQKRNDVDPVSVCILAGHLLSHIDAQDKALAAAETRAGEAEKKAAFEQSWREDVSRALCNKTAEYIKENTALKARLGRVEEALKTAVEWLRSDHFRPPTSCGGCGTPAANCDCDCAIAATFASDYAAMTQALQPPDAGERGAAPQ
jgi:hypothetical protein